MRSALLLTLSLSCAGLCLAQSPAASTTTPDTLKTAASIAPSGIEKRTERIIVEDGGSRIDELRIGGETRSISVQPKGRMPAYQIQPESGERSWKILGF
jgi:hypothetical protein